MDNTFSDGGRWRQFNVKTLTMRWAVCFAAVVPVLLGTTARSEPPSPADIMEAWAERRTEIKSLQYTCRLQIISSETTNLPFADLEVEARDNVEVQDFRTSLVFSMQNGMMSRSMNGCQLDGVSGKPVKRLFQACFSGKDYRTLLQGGALAMGELTETDPPAPGGQLTNGTELVAIWLSTCPQAIMDQLHLKPREMSIVNADVSYGGRACFQAEIPRGGKGWRSEVYLMQSAPYLPTRFALILNGISQLVVSMSYEEDDDRFPLSSFEQEIFDETGRPVRTIYAQVENVKINEVLPPSTFVLDYPVGAHVVHKKANGSREIFEQLPNGERRRMRYEEFGRLRDAPLPKSP